MTHHSRALVLDATRADKKQRRVPAVVSSEFPVNRGAYTEVLLHGPENVDLSRAPLPLIESHDGRSINIGLVENLRLTGGKLRGDVVLGTSTRANELWPDIEAGIVRNLSVGYAIETTRERGNTLEATRWQPFEVSIVSVPADPQAGTYRSYPMTDSNTLPAGEAGEHLSRSQRLATNRAVEAERERAEGIRAMRDICREEFRTDPDYTADIGRYADEAIARGDSSEAFRVKILKVTDAMREARRAANMFISPAVHVGAGAREYSVSRMLTAILDPRSNVDIGYEREISQELQRQRGRKAEGFLMPMGALAGARAHQGMRALTVAGAPDLVGETHLAGEFIDRLRARSTVMRLGPRMLTGLTEDQSLPRLLTSSTSGWIAGDGTDALSESTPTFDSVKLTPHTVGALTTLSRKMVLQGSPDGENLIKDDFAKIIALEIDRAALAGTGLNNQPKGIVNAAGITTDTYALAGPAFQDVLDMEAALMADFADQGSLAYLTTPQLAAVFKGKEITTGSGQMVWTASNERGRGTMNGLPAYASGNVPTDNIIFGNWADLLVGVWSSLEIAVDPYHDFSKGVIAVRVFADVDFAVRHPESFAVWTRGAS